jgi:hypothetical protein
MLSDGFVRTNVRSMVLGLLTSLCEKSQHAHKLIEFTKLIFGNRTLLVVPTHIGSYKGSHFLFTLLDSPKST